MPNCKLCSASEMPLCDVSKTRFAYKALFTEYFCNKCKGEKINFALVCNICNVEIQYKLAVGGVGIIKHEFMKPHLYHVYKKIIDKRVQEFKDEIKALIIKGSYANVEYIYVKDHPPHIFSFEKLSSQITKFRKEGETAKDAWKLANGGLYTNGVINVEKPLHDPGCTVNYSGHKLWDKCKFGNAEALKNGDNSFLECSTEFIASAVIKSCSAITLTYSMNELHNVYGRDVFKKLRANGIVLNCLICNAQYDTNISDLVIYEHFTACMNKNKEELAKITLNVDTLRIYRHEVE